jgi:choline kinase
MDAIILAAGLGSRIRQQHSLPKGFIQVGGISLIEQSIKILRYYGIDNILIVTGYMSQCYQEFADSYSSIDTINNSEFEQTGSLYSWYLAQDWIRKDFLLLESDILFSETIVAKILADPHPNSIAVTEISGADDAVYLEARNSDLVNMSKDQNELPSIIGELVGISKITANAYRQLVDIINENPSAYRTGHYETDRLVTLAKHFPLHCLSLGNEKWCEIDDNNHLQRAQQLLPLIRHKSRVFDMQEAIPA